MNTEAAFVPWPEDFAARYRAAGYWQRETLGALLRRQARKHPQRCALVCAERRWSYAELDVRADRLAAGLRRLGVQAGDRVVLQLPNVAEFYLACFALFRLGAIPVMALAAHRRVEIEYLCAHSEARAYILAERDGSFDCRTLAREVCAALAHPPTVVVLGEAAEFVAFDALYQAPQALPEPAAEGLALLQLSGGSTGLPKLIPRTHADYLYSVRASAEICALDAHSVYLCVLPAAHNFALSSPGALGVWHAGGCVVLARNGSPELCFELIAREKVSIAALVPPLAMLWLEAAPARKADLSSLRVLQVGGARLADAVARRIEPVLGCRLQQVFGMAEGLVNYTRFDDPADLIETSQGRPISPADEVRIVDDEDQDLPDGVPGHLLTRGPYTIRGYYKAPAHNARAFTHDGFYRSGDIVRRLPGGYLVVEGRAKDQINRGGEKIAAEEVESLLLAHPMVLDVALVAVPDAYLGERACACVVPREAAPRALELARYLHGRGLAAYKVPDRFEMFTSLPITAVGKTDKRALRELMASRVRTKTDLATSHTD